MEFGRTHPCLASLDKTIVLILTNTVSLSSGVRRCSIIRRISPASAGLVPRTSYRGFAAGSRWRTPISPDFPTTPLLSCWIRPSLSQALCVRECVVDYALSTLERHRTKRDAQKQLGSSSRLAGTLVRIILAALCNRGALYFCPVFSIFFFFYFFPRLISAAAGWMSTIL